ncbi:MAG: hypothetical protein ACRCWF_10565 [Beijerinckiaceae bacterium]
MLVTVMSVGIATAALSQVHQIPGVHEARLSGWCQSIGSEQKISANLGDFRVRKGGHLVATGVRQSIFVEDGGSVEITGTASVVYIMKGGKATIAGERNQIYAEPGSNVALLGAASWSQVSSLTLQLHRNAVSCQ